MTADLILHGPASPATDLYFSFGAGGQHYVINFTDAAPATDTVGRSYRAVRALDDTVAGLESLVRTVVLQRLMAEAAIALDQLARRQDLGRELGISVVVTETLERTYAALRDVGGAALAVDMAARGYSGTRSLAEVHPTFDTLQRAIALLRALQDVLVTDDSVAARGGQARAITMLVEAFKGLVLVPS